MKVLMVTPYYFPIIGGTESFIESISLKLNQIGITAEILTFNFDERINPVCENKIEEINGNRVIKISCRKGIRPLKLFQIGLIPGRFLNYLKNYDIIHFHNETDLTLPFFSYFVKKPKIIHCHCLDVSYLFYRKNLVSCYVFRKIANIYMAVSHPIRSLLINLGIPEYNIRIVPNCVDTKKFRPRKESKAENLLLFVGRLQPKKGLHILLKSLEYVTTPVKLMIIGPVSAFCPEYYNETSALIKKVNEKTIHKVIYLGVQKREELINLYQKATIFVCPSLSEPFGIVNLEALACETPVIASNVGGIPEVVKDQVNGLLVPSNDFIRLADSIQYLLDNEDIRRTFGRNGRKWVEEHFSMEVVAEKLRQIYEELTSQIK